MNAQEIKGNWKQLKGKVQQKWGKLTDDDLDQVKGQKQQLAGILQSKYGEKRERWDEKVDEFFKSLK